MCLAVPMEVIEIISEFEVRVESFGVSQKVRTEFVGELKQGDFVMVHAGCAIEKVDLEMALESLALWEELLAAEGGEE